MNHTSARIGFYLTAVAILMIPYFGEVALFLALICAWGQARVTAGLSPCPFLKGH